MKLSEAIREGIETRPRQCFGRSFDGEDGCCAIGAVWEAEAIRGEACDISPIMFRPCPECEVLVNLLPHLNDFHRWTRERIADFLESIGQ